MRNELSLAKEKIRILLLEGLHENASRAFKLAGYSNVERLDTALPATDLAARLADVHIVGIRSRTQLTGEVLAAAPRLFSIGCFCIGTNQVDLDSARIAGIPVFNAPYSNTRSVAELTVGEAIMLQRGIPHKSALAHQGIWAKSARGAHEVRGKVLGIVGYGHIGSQVSVLAEGLGMQVIYFDIVPKLSLGNAQACDSLDELLTRSDMVTLHVPETQQTRLMIGAPEIARMRPGAMLLNASRGSVVDLEALADALRTEHLAGAAVDVYPVEPSSGDERLATPLQGLRNVILTPHVGGSTQEAQASIGVEVANKLIRYSDAGATLGAVNFPEVSLPEQREAVRFLHIHRDEPGMLSEINRVFAGREMNVIGQYLRTDGGIGYVVVDALGAAEEGVAIRDELLRVTGTIRARFLR